jgi:hypothetical protein
VARHETLDDVFAGFLVLRPRFRLAGGVAVDGRLTPRASVGGLGRQAPAAHELKVGYVYPLVDPGPAVVWPRKERYQHAAVRLQGTQTTTGEDPYI